MKKILTLAIIAGVCSSCSTTSFLNNKSQDNQTNIYSVNAEKYEAQADKLLSQMTLEEKLYQFHYILIYMI